MLLDIIAGARPNFMKIAPIVSALERRKKEAAHQTSPSEAGEIFSYETFRMDSTAFFWYILRHLLGASFPLHFTKHILPERRLFCP